VKEEKKREGEGMSFWFSGQPGSETTTTQFQAYPPPAIKTTESKIILSKIWACGAFTFWVILFLACILLIVITVTLLVYLPQILGMMEDFHKLTCSIEESSNTFTRMFPNGDPAAVRTLFPKTEEELVHWRDKSSSIMDSAERIIEQFSHSDIITSISILMNNIAFFSGTKEFQVFRERVIIFILKVIDLAENDPQVHIALRSFLAFVAQTGHIEITQLDEGTVEYRIVRKIDKKQPGEEEEDSLTTTIISDLKGFLHRTDVVALGAEVAKLVPEVSQLISTVNKVSNSSELQQLFKDLTEAYIIGKKRVEQNDTQLFINNILSINVSDAVQDFKHIRNVVDYVGEQINQTHIISTVSKTSNTTSTILNSLKNIELWNDASFWYRQFRATAFVNSPPSITEN
jgi:hypothetical protein